MVARARKMTFEAIPAVDLKGGRCVQLVQGKPGTELVSLPDPVSIASEWVDRRHQIDG